MNKLLIGIALLLILMSCSNEEIEPFDFEKAVKKIDPYLYKMGELQQGETLADALTNKGIENGLVYTMVNKLNNLYDLRYAHENDKYAIKLDTLGVVQELVFQPDKIHTYWVVRDSADYFTSRIDTLTLH